jgi:type VI protein secretion system component Hcp
MTTKSQPTREAKITEVTDELTQKELDNVSAGGKAKTKDSFPSESISLNYDRIEWTYTQQN